jgi:hypothetical protein
MFPLFSGYEALETEESSPETVAYFYQAIRCHIPQDTQPEISCKNTIKIQFNSVIICDNFSLFIFTYNMKAGLTNSGHQVAVVTTFCYVVFSVRKCIHVTYLASTSLEWFLGP